MASSSILAFLSVLSYRFDISVKYIERIYRNDIWGREVRQVRGDERGRGSVPGPSHSVRDGYQLGQTNVLQFAKKVRESSPMNSAAEKMVPSGVPTDAE